MLDAGPLGRIAHEDPKADILNWFDHLELARVPVIIPEIADFEVRRNLILHRRTESLRRLDALHRTHSYSPVTTAHMRRAAELWADVRRRGAPTADPKELDCDVILAAQAVAANAIVATENVGHLARYVRAAHWGQIIVS